MAVAGKLTVSGKSYRILHCDYEFFIGVDKNGEPNAATEGGYINITIESIRDEFIHNWNIMFLLHSGEIQFISRESESAMRRIQFEDAFCIYFKEIFDFNNEEPMRIQFRLSCKKLVFETVDYQSDWSISTDEQSSSSDSSSSGGSSSSEGGVSSFNPND